MQQQRVGHARPPGSALTSLLDQYASASVTIRANRPRPNIRVTTRKVAVEG